MILVHLQNTCYGRIERHQDKNTIHPDKNQGYYIQGDDNIERKYNHSVKGKYSFKNKIIPALWKMPASE